MLICQRCYMPRMNCDPRIRAAKPFEHRGEQPGDKGFIATDLDLAKRPIAEKLNIPQPLTQLIKNGCCALEQRATIGGWLVLRSCAAFPMLPTWATVMRIWRS